MEKSRNEKLTPEILIQTAKDDLASKELPTELSFYDAAAIVQSIDNIADTIRAKKIELSTDDLFATGCVLGYMFYILFEEYTPYWTYVKQWQRWGLELKNTKNEVMHLNIFNKVEKRFENGDEDSLDYYMHMTAKTMEGGLVL